MKLSAASRINHSWVEVIIYMLRISIHIQMTLWHVVHSVIHARIYLTHRKMPRHLSAPGVHSNESDIKNCCLWNGWAWEETLSPEMCTTRKLRGGRKKASQYLAVGLWVEVDLSGQLLQYYTKGPTGDTGHFCTTLLTLLQPTAIFCTKRYARHQTRCPCLTASSLRSYLQCCVESQKAVMCHPDRQICKYI